MLRKYREDIRKDIKQIAAITRIKESCLRAIEDEQYDKLPVEVYTRGYIREYAKYLGAPVDAAMEPYERYLEMKEGPEERKAAASLPEIGEDLAQAKRQHANTLKQTEKASFCKEVKEPLEVAQVQTHRESPKIYGSKFIWKGLLLLIVAAAIIYQYISSRNAEQEARIAPLSQEAPYQKEPSIKTETPPAPAPPANVPAAAVQTPENQPPVKKKHILMISANDTTWVQVVMDGAEKKEALMKKGDSAEYEARQTVSVIVGNAGGVTMKFDGKELPAGKKGAVLRITLPEKKATGIPESSLNVPQKPQAAADKKVVAPGESNKEKSHQPVQSSKPSSQSASRPAGTPQP